MTAGYHMLSKHSKSDTNIIIAERPGPPSCTSMCQVWAPLPLLLFVKTMPHYYQRWSTGCVMGPGTMEVLYPRMQRPPLHNWSQTARRGHGQSDFGRDPNSHQASSDWSNTQYHGSLNRTPARQNIYHCIRNSPAPDFFKELHSLALCSPLENTKHFNIFLNASITHSSLRHSPGKK